MEPRFVISYRELKVYQSACDGAMQIFDVSREFPPDEQRLLTIPMLHSSRFVSVYIAQAWQKRRYQSAFIAKLNQAEMEAASTQVWVEFAVLCSYLDAEIGQELHHQYQEILTNLNWLIERSATWVTSVEDQF